MNRHASPKVTDLPIRDEQVELRKRFVAARAASGLSQEEAAAAVGMSGSSVARKERGEQIVTKRDVAAMEQLVRDQLPGTMHRNGSGRDATGSPGPRFAWTRVVALDNVRAFLRAFGDELHALGASPDEEDEAVRSVRESGGRAYNAEQKDWTEDEAIDLMKIAAEPLREYFTGLKRRR